MLEIVTYPEGEAQRVSRGPSDFIVFRCIKFLQMMTRKELGKDMFSYGNQDEEWQGEQYSSNRNPCHSITDKEIYNLEEGKHGDVFVGYRLYKGSMITFQDPAKDRIITP